VTAAGFLEKEDEILEAHRRQLFAWHPDMPEEAIRRSRTFQLVKELTNLIDHDFHKGRDITGHHFS
jgi:hypothetical protein